jgi:hypothetical protein
MQNFKKNLGFNLALVAIAVLFVAGCVMAFLAYRGSSPPRSPWSAPARIRPLCCADMPSCRAPRPSRSTIRTSKRRPPTSRPSRPISPRSVVVAGNPDLAIKGKASANSAELSALLRESVDGWRKLAADQGIKLMPNDPTAFGFHRYIHNQGTSPKRDFQKVDQQRQIIDFIVRQLAESRPAGSPLLIESIDREPVETFILMPRASRAPEPTSRTRMAPRTKSMSSSPAAPSTVPASWIPFPSASVSSDTRRPCARS